MQVRMFGQRLALIAAMFVPLTACQTLGARPISDAHDLYQLGDYASAALRYESVIADDPDLAVAYFYLGNSYDNLYQPDRRGEPDNDRWLELAIDNYRSAVDRETDAERRTRAMQYLAVAYGPGKADDPEAARPLLEQLVQRDRSNAYNHTALGTLYHRAGEFEKGIAAFREVTALEPDNPVGFYTIATYYWEKAFRGTRLSDEQRLETVVLGIIEVDKALSLGTDYVEALVYKNILLRMQANQTGDPERQARLIAEADRLRDRARVLLRSRRAASAR